MVFTRYNYTWLHTEKEGHFCPSFFKCLHVVPRPVRAGNVDLCPAPLHNAAAV